MITLVAAILFAAAVLFVAGALERLDGKCISHARLLRAPPLPRDLTTHAHAQNANTARAEKYSLAEVAEIVDWLDES
jgi:hypothetical protein